MGKIVEFPMDTVKVLMQTQDRTRPAYASSTDCAKQIWRSSGLGGFYRGLATPLVGSMAEISTLMTTYGFFKRLLGEHPDKPELPAWKLALASGGSGIGVSCVLTPVELIKCKLQVQHSLNYTGPLYKGPLDCIYQICLNESPLGLTRGLGSTLIREIPGNVAWFGAYEATCSMFRKGSDKKEVLNPGVYMLAGAMAGVGYWTIPFPADTVKTKIQTAPPGVKMKFWPTLMEIVRKEGVPGLYRGWLITVLRAAPANAAVFYSYEMCMHTMGEQDTHGHPALASDSAQDIEHVYHKQQEEMRHLEQQCTGLRADAVQREEDIDMLQQHLAQVRAQYEKLRATQPGETKELPALPRIRQGIGQGPAGQMLDSKPRWGGTVI